MIRYITGDVFENIRPGEALTVIAHGVNRSGAFGAGVAKAVRERWPGAAESYFRVTRGKDVVAPQLGEIASWTNLEAGVAILHCFTQPRPGPCASPYAIAQAIDNACRWVVECGDNRILRLPWIGCGIGGLRRADVRPMLEYVAARTPVDLRVYKLATDSDDPPVRP